MRLWIFPIYFFATAGAVEIEPEDMRFCLHQWLSQMQINNSEYLQWMSLADDPWSVQRQIALIHPELMDECQSVEANTSTRLTYSQDLDMDNNQSNSRTIKLRSIWNRGGAGLEYGIDTNRLIRRHINQGFGSWRIWLGDDLGENQYHLPISRPPRLLGSPQIPSIRAANPLYLDGMALAHEGRFWTFYQSISRQSLSTNHYLASAELDQLAILHPWGAVAWQRSVLGDRIGNFSLLQGRWTHGQIELWRSWPMGDYRIQGQGNWRDSLQSLQVEFGKMSQGFWFPFQSVPAILKDTIDQIWQKAKLMSWAQSRWTWQNSILNLSAKQSIYSGEMALNQRGELILGNQSNYQGQLKYRWNGKMLTDSNEFAFAIRSRFAPWQWGGEQVLWTQEGNGDASQPLSLSVGFMDSVQHHTLLLRIQDISDWEKNWSWTLRHRLKCLENAEFSMDIGLKSQIFDDPDQLFMSLQFWYNLGS